MLANTLVFSIILIYYLSFFARFLFNGYRFCGTVELYIPSFAVFTGIVVDNIKYLLIFFQTEIRVSPFKSREHRIILEQLEELRLLYVPGQGINLLRGRINAFLR